MADHEKISNWRRNLEPARPTVLAMCRSARAQILADSEAFQSAAITLEQMGQIISGEIKNGLGRYKDELLWLAGGSADGDVSRLFKVILEARNDAAHEGAWIRHRSYKLVDFLVMLEESLMDDLLRVKDLMVPNPIFVESWQSINHVRKLMLDNSFSFIPMVDEQGKWWLIPDYNLMECLQTANSKNERTKRKASKIIDGISAFWLNPKKAESCFEEDIAKELVNKLKLQPLLVFKDPKNQDRLVGILTSFDLL